MNKNKTALELKILKLYKDGNYPFEIVNKLKCNKSTVYRVLKKENIVPRKMDKTGIKDEEKNEILKLYLEGLTIEKIQTIYQHLKKDQINYFLRKEKVTRKNGKQVTLNHDYFENIDTESKAYFLGLLMADGSLQKVKNSINSYSYHIGIALNTEDEKVIDIFRKEVETDLKIRRYNRKYENRKSRWESKLELRSEKMFNDLSRLGKKPMKLETCLEVPKLKEELIWHFIRGYFDGDGTIYRAKNYDRPIIAFYGTFEFLNSLKKEISKVIDINRLNVHKKKDVNISMLTISKIHEIQFIYNKFYENANVFMDRRKNKFDQFFK